MVLVVVALSYSGTVWAQQIVLVRPTETDPTLSEAFNRLRGELGMHGLELSVSDEREATDPEQLATLAAATGAVASVAFTRNEEEARVSIWIGNPTAGQPMARTISTANNDQAPSVLALRAVEYLRANLRDFGGGKRNAAPTQPEDAAPTEPEDATPAKSEHEVATPAPPREVAIESRFEQPSHWFFHGGISALVNRPDAHLAVGPTLAGVGLQPRPWVALRVMFAAPLFGTRYLEEDPNHRATLFFLLGTGELTFEALLGDRVRLAAGGAGGVGYVDQQGNAGTIEPSRRMAIAGPTAGLGLVLSPRAELRLDGQSLWFIPPVVASAAADEILLGQPALAFRLGAVIRP